MSDPFDQSTNWADILWALLVILSHRDSVFFLATPGQKNPHSHRKFQRFVFVSWGRKWCYIVRVKRLVSCAYILAFYNKKQHDILFKETNYSFSPSNYNQFKKVHRQKNQKLYCNVLLSFCVYTLAARQTRRVIFWNKSTCRNSVLSHQDDLVRWFVIIYS